MRNRGGGSGAVLCKLHSSPGEKTDDSLPWKGSRLIKLDETRGSGFCCLLLFVCSYTEDRLSCGLPGKACPGNNDFVLYILFLYFLRSRILQENNLPY